MRKVLKYFFLAVALLLHVVLFGVVNYVTPNYEVTNVTGVEVKRVDKADRLPKPIRRMGRRGMCTIFIRKNQMSKM